MAAKKKRYTDVKRRITRVPSASQVRDELAFPVKGSWMRQESRANARRRYAAEDRLTAAAANKRKSATRYNPSKQRATGRSGPGSAIANAADVSMNNPPGF